jgi:DNA (cytosine-5)-methyltransferase 1
MTPHSFYEFFAGGGMARAGLGASWNCLFANDIDPKKGAAYAMNWGERDLCIEDVAKLVTGDLPGKADLVWASFPCQDLSLAGNGQGLRGARSGTFWPFWNLIRQLKKECRAPSLIVLENVCGALTSHNGKDFCAISRAIVDEGYRFGALIVDAVHFVPQSRPRLFLVAMKDDLFLSESLVSEVPLTRWTSPGLLVAYRKLPKEVQRSWLWWKLPMPPERRCVFADLLDDEPKGVAWHTKAETKRLLELMSPLHQSKIAAARKAGGRIGTVYKRMRQDERGHRVQRAEIRFDDIAGCLRTPVGGSSRQLLMCVERDCVRSRLLSPREAARLMGLPEAYKLPEKYNQAYHLAGDGVVVPVVRHLAEHILAPALASAHSAGRQAA